MLLLQCFVYCLNAYSGYEVMNKTSSSHLTNERMLSPRPQASTLKATPPTLWKLNR